MSTADLIRLIVLAALWGASFLFMRIAAPSLGAIVTAEIRVLLAGIILYVYALRLGEPVGLRAHWVPYVLIGGIGSAIPFALYSYSAMHSPAGLNAIINATSPLYSAIAAALFLGDRMTTVRMVAIVIGAAGVWVLAGDFAVIESAHAPWALAAALGAALCYGLSGVYTKLTAPAVSPLVMAAGTQLGAALILAPLLPVVPIPGPITMVAVSAAVALSICASVVGYVMYFQLLRDVGPVRAIYVTFLIPVFGVFWGVVFLDEQISARALAGGALILVAVWLETRMNRQR
ncbi:MAG: DMT family transporter [Burkholderiales bacterium]